eukprot:TRINITY_DN5649_c3_g1_i1.p1 TRINITY_DN5649_c3_g1~~TRINITY_DN5649_c3_g1_i1.p1  ORF type:complete len:228 (+),score=42.74 TRINITY_DN5649_c3_g1_i1:43-684(+)
MVGLAAKVGDLETAEGWFNASLEAGVEPDCVMYTTLISAASKTGQADIAEAWFQKTLAAGMTPDVVTYTALAEAHARVGNMARAERIFHQIDDSALELVPQTWSAIILGHARSGNVSAAARWFGKMERRGFAANGVHYKHLLRACAESKPKEVNFAEELFNQMLDKGVTLTHDVLKLLGWAIGRSRCRELCEEAGVKTDFKAQSVSRRSRKNR